MERRDKGMREPDRGDLPEKKVVPLVIVPTHPGSKGERNKKKV